MKQWLFSAILVSALVAPQDLVERTTPVGAAYIQAAPQADPTRPRYSVTDLGLLGGDASQAYGLSNKGHVVGSTEVNISAPEGNPYHAFLWEDGVMSDLGTFGGWQSTAFDVNDEGHVVGTAADGSQSWSAFVWKDGAMAPLGTLGGQQSYARAINVVGQIVGTAELVDNSNPEDPDYLPRAFRWQNGSMQNLGTLGGNQSHAYDINDAGAVVGNAQLGGAGNPPSHAFLWRNGTMQDLGTLGGPDSVAHAINNRGDVVGASYTADGNLHAFLRKDGEMRDLGTLGGASSTAHDINDFGLVVGQSLTAGQGNRAVLWENGQIKNLNSLIPANTGWALGAAYGINKGGQIVGVGGFNGIAHAFLLTPLAYYWVNPSGGAWHLATNWDPQGIPGDGDTAIFGLNGVYAVDATAPPAVAQVETAHLLARMVISSTTTVDFNNLNLSLTSDSPEEPSLEVSHGSTVNVNSGTAAIAHAIVGGQDPDDPTNPPTARLQVFNNGTTLTGSGRLTIGDKGLGDLFVANGGHLTSAESRLGGTRAGTAVVGGDGSLWQTGSIAVGFGVSGTLTIEAGGRVDSKTASVGYGPFSRLSLVEVDGVASGGASSLWSVEENLTVGEGNTADVIVRKGAQLAVNQNVFIKQGSLSVIETTPGGDGSSLNVLGHVVVGGSPDYGAALTLNDGAEGEIGGNLVVGQGGPGVVIITSDANAPDISILRVTGAGAGLCAFGRAFDAETAITYEGFVVCRNVEIGQAGTNGGGTVHVNSGTLMAWELVHVAAVGSGPALVTLESPGTLPSELRGSDGVYVAPTGTVSGTGVLAAGGIGLLNEGVIHPGVSVVQALGVQAAAPQANAASLLVSGTLSLSDTSRLEIPVTGSGAGQYGSLAATGAARIAGVLALDFQGYTPKKGDMFTLLSAAGGITGAFESVEIGGLPPGFTYKVSIVGGQAVLEALSDGFSHDVLLPLVVR